MDWQKYLPFSDVAGFVRFAIGVVVILLVLKYTGTKKFVS